jgi:DNA invertase Pin-like site-specific DNA recombinase
MFGEDLTSGIFLVHFLCSVKRRIAMMEIPRFVGYVRVSTRGQEASGLGLEAQRTLIRRHLEGTGGMLLEEYQETESRRKTDQNRPVLAAALEKCRQEQATLLIAKLDRLAGNVHFVSGLMESGVDFLACDMPTKDRFMLHVQAAFAEEDARRIGLRTREALAARRARGLPLGEQTHRESWTPRKAIARWKNAHRATEARMARRAKENDRIRTRAVELWQKFKTLREIAETLNAEGFRTERTMPWSKSSVCRLLQRAGCQADVHPGTLAAQRFRAVLRPRVKELIASGLSLRDIADRLNADGIQTRNGGVWDHKDVQKLLAGEKIRTIHSPGVLEKRREVTDPLLRELRERGGLPLDKIAEYLNEAGIPNPAGRPWNYQTVGNHLRAMGFDTTEKTAERVYRKFLLDPAEREKIRAKYRELSGRIDP